jgi:hypothetical protein
MSQQTSWKVHHEMHAMGPHQVPTTSLARIFR